MIEIGPNLQTFLLAFVASAIPAAVTIATLWFQARNSKASRDKQLGEIHNAVNGTHTAALKEITDLKTVVVDMRDARGPIEQAAANQAGDEALKK